LERCRDEAWEPGFDAYKEHLAALNQIIRESGAPLEGSPFYYHHDTPADKPDARRINRRRDIALYASTGESLLEIGFNAGYGCLLALTVNPSLRYTGIDIAWNPYTEPCGAYLKSAFGDRFDLIIGDSREVLPRMCRDHASFDLIRSDAGHDFGTAQSNLLRCIELMRPNGVILVDVCRGDSNLFILDAMVDFYCARGAVSRVTLGCLWHGVGDVLLRVNK
jgi:SAM-dependent methyltransferase